MASEFYAKLGIFSETLTPEKIDTILEIKCDKGYHIGEKRGGTLIHEETNGWIVFSRVPRNASMENHINDILDRISLVQNKIKSISDQPGTEVELGCIFHSKEEPSLFFTKGMIERLYQIGASIDIDLYFWERDSEDK